MKILTIGDVFGKPGRKALLDWVPQLIASEELDLVIANGENAAGGKGITPEICDQFWACGVDVITTGNHLRDHKEIDVTLSSSQRILKPFNYPPTVPGVGHTIIKARNNVEVAVVNAIGKIHMGSHPSPFEGIKDLILKIREITPFIVLDFHAEATSEKRAMGWYLDGLVSCVVGTHTHIQTADEELLPQGTAYITDIGMTGPHASVIGMDVQTSLRRFLNLGKKFEVAKSDVKLCGAIVHLKETGLATSIKRVCLNHQEQNII